MRTDYLLDTDYDMIIRNGDFAVGISDQNHKAVNILSGKGGIKQYVRIGVNIREELNGILNQDVRRRILESFKRDGYNLRNIRFEDEEIIIP